MPLDSFAASRSLTLGVELELQIVSTHDYDLMPSAADLLRVVGEPGLPGDVKPEITASMIELSTGICADYDEALRQLREIRDVLVAAADRINVGLCGGGTHPFQHWGERRIFETPRYQQLSELYGYLAKQFTVFGQHVHVGCSGPDEALKLLHCLSRYVPHFIALSASSPYNQGYDTGFQSSRLNSIFAFPLSGRAPFVETWADFGAYFDKITATGVVKSMKDFYWDIRPKPEFGTVEVRVMDTPLTVSHAARLAAYIQALARWLLVERPFRPAEDDYLVYTFNRFQACRFGYAGAYVDPGDHRQHTLGEHILETLEHIRQHAAELRADAPLAELADEVRVGVNDAVRLRDLQAREHSLPEVVRQQCQRWRGN